MVSPPARATTQPANASHTHARLLDGITRDRSDGINANYPATTQQPSNFSQDFSHE
jgi:hypothetical protein